MKPLRIVILVSDDAFDIYFANQLINAVNVVGVVIEKQGDDDNLFVRIFRVMRLISQPSVFIRKIFSGIARRLQKKIRNYHVQSRKINEEHFGAAGCKLLPPKACKVIYTEGSNDINNPVYVEEIRRLKPDLIAVCGTSILKKDILVIPQQGLLNLHGGLAQRYRGLWTTEWAIYNKEPEYVGATVHYISTGVDDGDIIYQGRPTIVKDDNPKTLYVKVVKLGISMMNRAIMDIQKGRVKKVPLQSRGELYLASMMTPAIRSKAWDNVKRGVISAYLNDRHRRDKKVLRLLKNMPKEFVNE